MIELLEFVFQSVWHFLGCFLLIFMVWFIPCVIAIFMFMSVTQNVATRILEFKKKKNENFNT